MTVAALAALAAIAAACWLLPALNQPTLAFGIRVPAEGPKAPVIAAQLRRYRRDTAVACAVAAVAGVLVVITGWWWPLPAGAVVLASATGLAYLRAHRAIADAKRREGWFAGLQQVTAIDTTLRTRPEPFPWLWAAPAVLVVAATAAVGAVWYPQLPETLAVHVGAGGAADVRVGRSVPVAFSPVAVQVLLTGLLIAVTVAGFGARADLDPANPTAAGERHRRFVAGLARRLLFMVACLDAALAVGAWSMWTDRATGLVGSVIVAVVAVGVLPLVVFAFRAGQGGHRLPSSSGEPRPGLTHRDDDAHWRLGLIYVNPADPAVLVPQRVGVGWTLNLGRPLAWLALGAVVLGGLAAVAVVLPILR